jgi:hypothetical protein
MSYIAFHFAEGETLNVRGMERAHLGFLANQIALGAVGIVPNEYQLSERIQERYGPFMPEYLERKSPGGSRFVEDFLLYLTVQDGGLFSWKGKPIDSWPLLLNTAIVAGSDPIALAAKIHAMCELHGFVEGKDRAWFADIVDQGCDTGLYRRTYLSTRNPLAEMLALSGEEVKPEDAELVENSMGWTEVADQLRAHDEGEVVMSFSVTEGFLYPPADWRPEGLPKDEDDAETDRWDRWDELPQGERWALAMAPLRAKGRNKPIGPKTLRANLFSPSLTLLDLASGNIEKIEENLGVR